MRKACFKSLAAACLTGLKKSIGLSPAQRADVRERLSRLLAAAPELEVGLYSMYGDWKTRSGGGIVLFG
jgi:hypothetical protein